MSPGVRIESGHPKKRLPAIRLGRHFPQAGNRAFSQVVRLFSVAVYRPLSRKAGTSENCGFVLCTKCGPCRTARKQFSKGLRSKTGVQQHPKKTQKRLFRQAESREDVSPGIFVSHPAARRSQRVKKAICSSVWNQCSPSSITVSRPPHRAANASTVSRETR